MNEKEEGGKNMYQIDSEHKILIPNVKNRKIENNNFSFENIACAGTSNATAFACTYLNIFYENIASAANIEDANMYLELDESLKNGAYYLLIDQKILIKYSNTQGIRNALATLLQLIEILSNKNYSIQSQEIYDFPDCDYRSVLIDLARGLPDFERLKEDIRRLSLVKCSYIHLHLMDMIGICYESRVFKMIEDIRGTKLYTKNMLKELVAYCQSLGIELIPEFEIPAHAYCLTHVNEKVACKTQNENQSPQVVCAGSEETYKFFAELIDEFIEIFPSQYLHMGGDELYFDDFPDWNYYPNWENCEICKKVMAEKQLNSVQELYYYVVFRIYEIVKSKGKTLIIFNDQLDVSKPLPFPKDMIVQFWRVSDKNRGPRTGCSYKKFLEQGYHVICSPFEYCYIDIEEYTNPEKTMWFNLYNYQECSKYKDLILGGEACAWEYGNPEYVHYNFSFTSSAALLLAKMWDTRNVVYNRAYRTAFSRLILGHYIPNDYDIFELFGSIMPPRLNDKVSYASLDNALLDEELLEKHIAALRSIPYTYSNIYLQGLHNLINKFTTKKEQT